MQMTFKGLSKSGKYALYSGLRTVTRMSVTDFPDNKPPEYLSITGDLAGPREPKAPKVKMTAAERKAYRLANPKPKLTLAEKAARAAKTAAKLAAALAAEKEAVPA